MHEKHVEQNCTVSGLFWSSDAEILSHDDDDDFRQDVCTLAKVMGHNWHERTPPHLLVQLHQSTTSVSTDTNTEPALCYRFIFGVLTTATNASAAQNKDYCLRK